MASTPPCLRLLDVRVAGGGDEGRQPVHVVHDLVGPDRPASILPGQRTMAGTRQPPSQLVFFSPRNGVMPASGQVL
jgi:hypothetical protein